MINHNFQLTCSSMRDIFSPFWYTHCWWCSQQLAIFQFCSLLQGNVEVDFYKHYNFAWCNILFIFPKFPFHQEKIILHSRSKREEIRQSNFVSFFHEVFIIYFNMASQHKTWKETMNLFRRKPYNLPLWCKKTNIILSNIISDSWFTKSKGDCIRLPGEHWKKSVCRRSL